LTVPPIQASPARVRCSANSRKKIQLKNIFVGNLTFDATESAVRGMFEVYGTVDRVNLVTDRDTGRARGFGFVEMGNDGEGEKAIAGLNGRDMNGRALNVNEAKPKENRASGGGGGGYRGGGGGGGNRQNRW
jgi:RNA recognition motif-containing protein